MDLGTRAYLSCLLKLILKFEFFKLDFANLVANLVYRFYEKNKF